MARRNAAQIRVQMRQAQTKQRQAVAKYNTAARRYNTEIRQRQQRLNQAVARYNTAASRHNAQVRANRARIQAELNKLDAQSRRTTVRTTTYRTSVDTLVGSYAVLDAAHQDGSATLADELLDLSGNEAANSVAVLNAMLEEPDAAEPDEASVDALRSTTIADELRAVDTELAARWEGALFALHPKNPDAGRHFCTSAREMLSTMLELIAPDGEVLTSNPTCVRTPEGTVSRRARIHHCLARHGQTTSQLEEFVDNDLENVLTLFREFNSGTHGAAGKFELRQLVAIKVRVEDAVRFVCRIAAPPSSWTTTNPDG